MIKARHAVSALAGILGLTALAPNASAAFSVLTTCTTNSWGSNQVCTYQKNALQSKTDTISNSSSTVHTITIALPAASRPGSYGLAVALSGNGTVIAGSDVDSVGPSNSRRFTTSASGAPRGMRTAIGAEPRWFDGSNQPIGEDNFPASGSQAVTVALYGESHPGTLRTQCYAFGGASATASSFNLKADLQAGDFGTNTCLAVAVDAFGTETTLRDDNRNGVQNQTFPITGSARPRKLRALTLASDSTR